MPPISKILRLSRRNAPSSAIKTVKLSAGFSVQAGQERTHQKLVQFAEKALKKEDIRALATVVNHASSSERDQIQRWLGRFTNIKQLSDRGRGSLIYVTRGKPQFNLDEGKVNPYWTLFVPTLSANPKLPAPMVKPSPPNDWSNGEELKGNLTVAFKRFLKEPSEVNRKTLAAFIQDYCVREDGKRPSVYVPVFQGGLPGLGKRNR